MACALCGKAGHNRRPVAVVVGQKKTKLKSNIMVRPRHGIMHGMDMPWCP